MRSSALLAFLVAALLGCGKSDHSATPGSAGGTTSAAPTPTASRSTAHDVVDEATVRDFRLRDGTVDRAIQANLNLAKLMASHPELSDKLDAMSDAQDDPKSLDDLVARIDAVPPVRKAIADAGISTRDWLLTIMTAISAQATYQMHQQGVTNKMPSTVSAENLAYAAAHQDRMKALRESADKMNQSHDAEQ